MSYADVWGNSTCTPSGGNAAAYPTQVTDPAGLITKHSYNSCTGTVASATDPNNQVTTLSYDLMDRPTQANMPDGGQTSTCFSEVSGGSCYSNAYPLKVVGTQKITSSLNKISTTVLDGIARVSQTQLNSDTDGVTYVDTTYDAAEHKATVSNPYRAGDATYVTTYQYDGMGRVTKVIPPDGSSSANNVSTAYDIVLGTANCTSVTDQAGKSRKSCSDALGRLTQVFEDPSGLNYETDYQYDVLNNLLRVDQKGSAPTDSTQWRTRTFAYNSLSQPLCAANPEITPIGTTCPNPDNGSYTAGTVRYAYDNVGNLLTKTSPKPNQTSSSVTVVTTYTYNDPDNRLTKKTYNDGLTPTVQFAYDNGTLTGCPNDSPPGQTDLYPKGRRTSMCDASGGTTWIHDTMGRIWSERRSISAVHGDYDTDTFNLDGSIASLTALGYGIGYTYNGAGRAITVKNFSDPNNYVTAATYAPFGGLATATMGAKPINITDGYNKRLQPATLSASTTAGTIMSLTYNFGLGTNDNGNVVQITNNRDGNRTQNFMYDSLNRIQQAYTTGTNWGEDFTIDAWGNLTNRSLHPGKVLYEPLSAAGGTQNRLPGFGYDAAGNMTSNASASYAYDAENRLIATAGISYLYDGDGKRVEKCTEATDSHSNPLPGVCASNPTGTMYWTGTGSDPLVETDLAGNTLENYIFFNGQRIARREPGTPATIHFYFSDHLGTHSLITDKNGTMPPQSESDYYPYGGEIPITTGDTNHYKFTRKERDSESGLDNFGARFDASNLGRFMSADPANVLKQKFVDPQQWNMYAYVRNNPLRFVDLTGKWLELPEECNARGKALEALRRVVGVRAGQYLYDNAMTVTDENGKKVVKHFLGILSAVPDSKGVSSFENLNAAAGKLAGIVNDTHRGATITLEDPADSHSSTGSLDADKSPGVEYDVRTNWADIYLTSGPIGTAAAGINSGKAYSPTLADVLSHELGQLDADWYHGGKGPGDTVADGDAVRMEDQTRMLNGEPLRTGHNKEGDIGPLGGMPF